MLKKTMYFNDNGDLVTAVDIEHGEITRYIVIRSRTVDSICDNVCRGIAYPYCSPMQHITREELAYIIKERIVLYDGQFEMMEN